MLLRLASDFIRAPMGLLDFAVCFAVLLFCLSFGVYTHCASDFWVLFIRGLTLRVQRTQ